MTKRTDRPKTKKVKDISWHQRDFCKNFKVADEIAAKLGCQLGSFAPSWRLHFHHHQSFDVPYEVMRELALLLGCKWKDKK